MRKNRIFALLCALTMILCACKKEQSGKSGSVPETTLPTQPQIVEILCEYEQDYRLFCVVNAGLRWGDGPFLEILQSPQDMTNFFEEHPWKCQANTWNDDMFDLKDKLAIYDDAFFQEKYVLIVAFIDDTLAHSLEIPKVCYGSGEEITVYAEVGEFNWLSDSSGTWCVVLEMDREYLVEAKNVTLDIQCIKGKTDGYFAPEHPSRKQGDG